MCDAGWSLFWLGFFEIMRSINLCIQVGRVMNRRTGSEIIGSNTMLRIYIYICVYIYIYRERERERDWIVCILILKARICVKTQELFRPLN